MLKTIRLLCITVSAGRSRSVKNAADTKLFAAPGLAKSKYRRFSRPASTAMHKRRSKNQVGLNCNISSALLTVSVYLMNSARAGDDSLLTQCDEIPAVRTIDRDSHTVPFQQAVGIWHSAGRCNSCTGKKPGK